MSEHGPEYGPSDPDDLVAGDATDAFSVEIFPLPNRTIVAVRGDLDLATAPFARTLVRVVLEHRRGPIEFDLRDLHFVDVVGSRVFLDAARRQWSGRPRITRASRPTRRLFELLGLTTLVDIN